MKRFLAFFLVLAACISPLAAGAATRPYAAGSPQGPSSVEMAAGSTKQITLKFKNAGTHVWRGAGKLYVSLYATGPYGRASAFRDASWAGKLQPAALHEALVRPGETGSVTFALHAPEATGAYQEQFQLAVEDTAWVYGAVTRLSIAVVPAEPAGTASMINAKAYAVMDAATGEVLDQKNGDEVRSIASITKLMTVMVAREAGLDPETTVVLAQADEVGGGRLRVPVGTVLNVRNLVASAIIGSANNAAHATARATGLSPSEFVQRMDEKAAALGMAHSRFADPTGIEVENLSTAKEVALMARAAFADAWISPFAAKASYDVATSEGLHPIKNTNQLLADAAINVQAGKTGFINEAGYTLATRVRQGEKDLIIVVLGCDSYASAYKDTKVLAEKASSPSKTAAL